ncbi:PHP domain-containing protein [Planctomonas deserti]|uniref:PHP domain-containing protein n=1 Tax=Planctomonas deserti TaxID=2144185 RepID=UPI000D3D8D0F|nr:PHP domain-containing protein [Planctomonas deserti]
MQLPADSHAHSEWSWDALSGSLDRSCARAVALGMPAIAFTEHLDFTPFRAGHLVEGYGHLVVDGILHAPPFDVDGYLSAVDACRARYPGLRILTGLEVGQPHHHGREVADVLARGRFDRVLGSLHCLPDGDAFAEPFALFPHRDAPTVMREYLAELPRMVAGSDLFEVVSHIDYPVRSWPEDAGPFDPEDFEEEFRTALRAVADADRVLEVNAKLPLDPRILAWWREEGGRRVTFGSDGHEPETVGRGLERVAVMAASQGFGPTSRPEDPWLLGARA